MGTSVSYAIFALGIIFKNIPLLFFARAFDGITGGNIAVAQASIADITAPQNRAKNFGLIGAAFGLGFILGPYLGGKLSDPEIYHSFNATTPFWFAAILAFLNVVSLLIFLPETRKSKVHSLKINWSKSFKNVFHAFNLKQLRPLFITGFLFQSGFSFYITFLSVFLIIKFGFDQGNIGNYFAYVGLWVSFTQLVITRFLAKKFKENQVLKISMAGAGLSVILLFLITNSSELFLIAVKYPVFQEHIL